MSNYWYPPADDGTYNFSPWNHDNTSLPEQDFYRPHQSFSSHSEYPRPPQSSPNPHLPFPGSHVSTNTLPGFHSTHHLRPQQQPTPSASLHAALREGTDFLPRTSNLPRLPPLSRYNSTPNQQSAFGYIPSHFFYSPPQSPQDPEPPQQQATNTFPAQNPAATSSNVPLAGPSGTSFSSTPFHPSQSFYQPTGNHSASPTDVRSVASSAFGQPQDIKSDSLPHHNHSSPTNMPSASSSATHTAASRKRSRASLSGTPPAATKRRLNPPPIEIDDSDVEEDKNEETSPDNDILAKEREALVNKQREESNRVNRIGELNCMICLEHFTNMTATHCGHIFCHECLTQALIASQRNSAHNYGTCPACRKPIKPKGKHQFVALTLKKGKKKVAVP